jgi:hypothetical protein
VIERPCQYGFAVIGQINVDEGRRIAQLDRETCLAKAPDPSLASSRQRHLNLPSERCSQALRLDH